MDKLDQLLDLTEHPDRYTSAQIDRMLSGPEMRDLYETLSATSSALHTGARIDIDAEWDNFSRRHRHARRSPRFRRNVAAIIITLFTISAFATGIGFTLLSDSSSSAASESVQPVAAELTDITGRVTPDDSVALLPEVIIFENQPLRVIISQIAASHNLKAGFSTPAAAGLRMYLKWETSTPVKEVIETLNTFEQIDIRLVGDSISVSSI